MERVWKAGKLNISRHAMLTRIIGMSDPYAELRADGPGHGTGWKMWRHSEGSRSDRPSSVVIF